jgi:hydroxymethylpyrimidine pyrophosphatase-like HAD family hydrolase
VSEPSGKLTDPSRLRPIQEIDPAECRALVGVVFDVDDTLTRGGTLEEAAYSALFRLREAGLYLVAVTGRPLGFAELMARMWPIDLAVGENGAGYLRLTAAGLEAGYYAEPEERERHAALLAAIRQQLAAAAPWAVLADDQWARRYDLAYDVGERLRGLIEAAGARCLISSVHAHALLGDYDKASGVERACAQALGLQLSAAERARWLFVGDSGNDAAAFGYFPLSAGVANVREHLARLPVLPRYVSSADRGRGFAEIAEVVTGRR